MFLTVGFFVENQTNTTNQLHCLSALSMPATSVMRCCAYPVRWVRTDPLWWQAINLRIFAHTHRKVKQTQNNGGRWMILMMSCVVLWHQIGHDLTCHARSTQYNWATSCIQLPNFWENIVSSLSLYFSTCSSRVPLCASPSLDLRKPSRWKSAAQPRYSSRCSRSMAYKVKPFCLG